MTNKPPKTVNFLKLFSWLGIYFLIINISAILITSQPAYAQGNGSNPPDFGLLDTAQQAGLPTSRPDPTTIASMLINTFLGIIGVVAIIVTIYGGFLWMTSSGNEEKITKAKSLLTNAVIGLFIILASYALTSFIINSLKKATITPTAAPVVYTCGSGTGPGVTEACETVLMCDTGVPGVAILTAKTCPGTQVCCERH